LFSNMDSDDSNYVDIDSESEDENCTSFPKNKNLMRKLLLGGPQPRDTTGMMDSKKEAIENKDRIIRKKWTDARRWEHLKKNKVGSPPQNKMGHVGDTLRTLAEVERYCLCEGQMFPDKNIFWMRIAEEALLWNINVQAVRSEYTVLVVCGPSFHCEGTFREVLGWT
jgi:hypothetical protein